MRENCVTLARASRVAAAAAVSGAVLQPAGLHAEGVSGTIAYASKAGPVVVAPQHAYLIAGPDEVSGKPIRRVVLSVADVGSKIRACEAMGCADGGIGEGITIDLDAGSRLNYWFVANGQRVQYSGSAEPASLALTVNTPQRIAGRWDLDARAAGGPRIEVEFDAPLAKELERAR
jgi:hypothetical protein